MKTWDLNLKIESEIILNSFWKKWILLNSFTLDAEVNTITNRWRVKDKILLVEVACSLRVTKPHISESVSFSLSISSLSLYFSLLLIILCTTYMYQISVYTKRMLRFNVLQNVSLFARCTLFFFKYSLFARFAACFTFCNFYISSFIVSRNHIIDLSNCVLKAVLFILYVHISGYMYHWRNF